MAVTTTYYYYYYYNYYYYYYDYCYYYYCRDPMSSTQNPTILHGIQFVQTTMYYTYSGLVLNNSCTASQTILASRMSHCQNI